MKISRRDGEGELHMYLASYMCVTVCDIYILFI